MRGGDDPGRATLCLALRRAPLSLATDDISDSTSPISSPVARFRLPRDPLRHSSTDSLDSFEHRRIPPLALPLYVTLLSSDLFTVNLHCPYL